MRSPLTPILGVGLTTLGLLGKRDVWPTLTPSADWLLMAGLGLLAYVVLRQTYHRSGRRWPTGPTSPRPLRMSWRDDIKAFICWLDAFKRTYAIEPGLYFIGEAYDPSTPLLVTSNYHLTVYTLLRGLRGRHCRVLIIDTDGINVWCAASKGQFSHTAILEQLQRCDRAMLTDRTWLTLVLPKLAFAGVDIRALRAAHIRPVIGPIYARDLPAFLDQPKLHDCQDARVHFNLRARVFTWLPGFIQFLGHSLLVILGFWVLGSFLPIPLPWGIVLLTALVATAYPLLYPWLPGRRFADKGMWLGAGLAIVLIGLTLGGLLNTMASISSILFAFAISVFFALSYTGNSPVSNYSRVRKEIARYLPLDVALFATSLLVFWISEVPS